MKIENSHFKIGLLKPTTPETIGYNVETCAVLSIRSGICEDFLGDLQVRFGTDVTTNIS